MATSVLGGRTAPFIKPERVEAAPSYMWPNIEITTLLIPKFISQAQPVGGWVKIGNIGTFEIKSWNSILEITFQGRVKATGGGKTTFALSLSDKEVTYGSGMFDVMPDQLMQNVYAVFTSYDQVVGYYSPGICTLSLWGYTDSQPGGAVWMNPTGSDHEIVIVKEYLPFGSTYLPTIMK